MAYDLGDVREAVVRIEMAIRSLARNRAGSRSRTQRDLEELLGELVIHLPYHIAHLRRSLPKAIVTMEDGKARSRKASTTRRKARKKPTLRSG